MKAGLQVSVTEVELCGGNNDSVPRQLIDPATGALYDTTKYYWCNGDTKGMKANDTKPLLDSRGNDYIMNNKGFVAPVVNQPEESPGESENEPKEEGK